MAGFILAYQIYVQLEGVGVKMSLGYHSAASHLKAVCCCYTRGLLHEGTPEGATAVTRVT